MNEIKIINVSTGKETIREMTEKELQELEKAQADAQAQEQERAKALAARISAMEKLAALGLTEAEIKALTA
jgi:hypothetical protein